MPAIAKIPDDVLSEILCLAAGAEIYAKFDVSQVSARWRSVALNSPLLWTNIRVIARSYISGRVALPLVLERAGPSALLDIDLRGSFRMNDALYLATTLAPYAARMRELETPDEHFDALLASGLHFPALNVLRVRGVGPHRHHGPKLHLVAPDLRVLRLESVPPPNSLVELLSERIQEVSIHHCDGINATDLLTILARCVHLAHLTYIANPMSIHREDVFREIVPMRHLTTLRLIFPFPEILHLLENAVHRDTVLQTLSISTSCNREADCVRRLCAAVSRGLGQLVSFDFRNESTVLLRDDAGHTRDMQVMNIARHAWAQVWPHFAQEHSAQTSTEEVHIPFRYWNDFADGFAQYPPGPSLRILGLLVSQFDFSCAESDLPALRTFVLPGLERVEFWPSETSLPAVGVAYALRSISCGREDRPIAVRVCGLSQSFDHLRELIQEGSSGGTWNLVGAFE